MPINIREILYPNDTDTIKWEKVNYNFDQILANGGKEGPRGTKGDSGSVGATGTKGEKGDQGDQGVKGATGTSTNFWDQFTHDTLNANVLKPKDGTNTEETVVFIGDTTYTEGSADGALDPNAQLVVGQSSGLFYAQKWLAYGTGLTDIAIRGEETTDYDGNSTPGTNWIVQPEIGGSNTKLTIQSHVVKLDAYEKLNISSVDGVEFLQGGAVTVNPNITLEGTSTFNDNITINADASITGELSVDGDDAFFNGTGSINIPVGTTAQRTAGSPTGSIRYNSSTGKFEGYSSDWVDLNRLSNPTKTTYVAVQADSDYSLGEDDKINLVVQNTEIVDITNSTITANKDIKIKSGENLFVLGGSNGVIYPAGGLKPGGTPAIGFTYYASPSNGSADSLRRLDDYFYSEDYSPTGVDNGDSEFVFGYRDSASTVPSWFNSTTQFGKNAATNVNYTKIGNTVMVRGYYDIDLKSWPVSGSSDLNDVLVLGLGETIGDGSTASQFPFLNLSSSDIYVNVELWDAEVSNVVGSVNSIDDYSTVDIFGIVPAGKRYIELYYTYKETGETTPTGTFTYVRKAFSPGMLSEVNSSTSVKFMFSFNMPTGYNTGNNSYADPNFSSGIGGGGVPVGP